MRIITTVIAIFISIFDSQNGESHIDDLNLSNEDFQVPSASDKRESLNKSKISQCYCFKNVEKDYTICQDVLKCESFPKDIRIPTGILRISMTSIKVLRKDDFQNNKHFGTLHIEENVELEKIEPGIFIGMDKLANLSIISSKKLRFLERDAFEGLKNLVFIKIFETGFLNLKSFIPALSPLYVPNLRRLAISHMNLFPRVGENDFKDLNNTLVTVFSLDYAQIEYIHPKALNVFKNLVQLGLGKNFVSQDNLCDLVDQIRLNNIPLEYFALNQLGFNKVPYELLKMIGRTNVSHLGLSMNLFERIGKLPNMPNIKRLDLQSVMAFDIEDGAFDLVPNIEVLFIDKNQFSAIPQAILTKNMEFIDISFSGKYFKLSEGIFKNSSKMYYLNLSGNNIKLINYEMFAGLTGLNLLHIQGINLNTIGNSTFSDLRSLRHLYLADNERLAQILDENIFYGLVSLERLYLDNCGIETIGDNFFNRFTKLERLSLANNLIKKISPPVISRLNSLQELNISHNLITPWRNRLFEQNKNLTTVFLQNNKIIKITFEMGLDLYGLENLDLSDNPFDCYCEGMHFLLKVFTNNTYNNFIDRLKDYRCTYPEDNNLTVYQFLNQTNELGLCRYVFPKTICIISFLILFLVVILLKIIYHYKWQLKYWLFLIQITRNKKKRNSLKNDHKKNNYKYDAFVSYCNEDVKFVIEMVHMLENQEPFLKLCVYERDFQIGTVLTENVLENVAKSRKIMIILSEAYIKSPWCRWEAQIAENQRLFFEDKSGNCVNDSLVVIKLNAVKSKNLSPILRYLLKTRVYLQWDSDSGKQEVSWHKLREALM